MKIAVVGTGYVGLVAGACFAENGNEVICVDKDPAKVRMLQRGQHPHLRARPRGARPAEPERKAPDLHDRSGTRRPRSAQIVFIAVGTPTGRGRLRGPAARARRRPRHRRAP